MSEFEHQSAKPSVEAILFARLKLQRVIFGALALVLATLFVGALSTWMKMRHDLAIADQTSRQLRIEASLESDRAEEAEKAVAEGEQSLAGVRAMLGLATCRLAAIDVARGHKQRARTLLAEARVLGAPSWWPIVSHALHEPELQLGNGGDSESPVLCGALSGNGRVLALARTLPGQACVIELRESRGGKLLRTVRIPAIEGLQPPLPSQIRLNVEGSEFIAATAGRLLHGVGETVRDLHPPFDPAFEGLPGGMLRDLSADRDLQRICTSWGGDSVVLFERQGEVWSGRKLTAGVAIIATAFGPGGVVACMDGRKLRMLGAADTLWESPHEPENAVIAFVGPSLRVATRRGRDLQLASIEPGAAQATAFEHTLEAAPWNRLQFLSDGTLAVLAQSGTLGMAHAQNLTSMSLGEDAPTFAEVLPDGLAFATARGRWGLRADMEGQAHGRAITTTPPGMRAMLHAHGFAYATRNGEYVAQGGNWPPELHQAVFYTVQGPATFNGATLRLPSGQEVGAAEGVAAVCADGSVLLARGNGLVLWAAGTESAVTGLPSGKPHAVCVAANARIALVRTDDAVYLCDFKGPARLVEARRGVAPDLMALDADGMSCVVVYGNTASVGQTRQRSSAALTLTRPPADVALLFEGSVLASVEAGAIVCYEVATGRELLRLPGNAQGIESISRNELRVSSGGHLRILSLHE